jgi:hypothetical protein
MNEWMNESKRVIDISDSNYDATTATTAFHSYFYTE